MSSIFDLCILVALRNAYKGVTLLSIEDGRQLDPFLCFHLPSLWIDHFYSLNITVFIFKWRLRIVKVSECMWKHAKPKGCVQAMGSVLGVLAGDEAKRMPWSRQNRGLAWVCVRIIYYFFRIRKERHYLKGLEFIWDLWNLQGKRVTQSRWYIQVYKWL